MLSCRGWEEACSRGRRPRTGLSEAGYSEAVDGAKKEAGPEDPAPECVSALRKNCPQPRKYRYAPRMQTTMRHEAATSCQSQLA